MVRAQIPGLLKCSSRCRSYAHDVCQSADRLEFCFACIALAHILGLPQGHLLKALSGDKLSPGLCEVQRRAIGAEVQPLQLGALLQAFGEITVPVGRAKIDVFQALRGASGQADMTGSLSRTESSAAASCQDPQ